MGCHKRTAIEIPDPLLDEARRVAEREGTSLRALIAEGLRYALEARRKRRRFRLRDASVGGSGLCPELCDAGWERVGDLAYEGRGG